MAGMINWGAGLGALGESISRTAGVAALETLKSQLDTDRLKLADELAGTRESAGRAEQHGYAMMQQGARIDAEKDEREARTDSLRSGTKIAATKEAREQAKTDRTNATGDEMSGLFGRGATADYQKKFIETVRPYAEEVSKKTGVDPRVVIAQAAHESDWGRAAPGNNYFGVKGKEGAPDSQMLDTREVGPDGRPYDTKAPFRKYGSPADSFDHYAQTISGSRYDAVRNAKDLETQIAALGKSGYATDPSYAEKVGKIARSVDGVAGAAPSDGMQMPTELREALRILSRDNPEKAAQFAATYAQLTAPERVKPPEGYRKTADGNLEAIPGGPATKLKDAPSGFRWKDDGNLEFIPGGNADPLHARRAAPMNNEQARDAGFADRMANSQGILSNLDTEGTNAWMRMAEGVGKGGNYLQSKEYQQFRQAKEDFINAQLRRESGAAISKDEFEKADRQYFPQPGDGTDVIKQKAKNRQLTVDAMVRGAGPAYKPAEATGSEQSGAPKESDVMQQARDAIARGAPRDAVVKRLRDMGVDPSSVLR